ncbi:MAG: hypothetical protein H0U23_06455, partial [Blastocatellia bacterium]|nr:hypothetical protein [Blastocatellia bacterium]
MNKCGSPKIPVRGEGKKGILIVGEGPGDVEDSKNKPFAGESERFLKETLQRHGVVLRRDCWTTNSVICSPGFGGVPTSEQVGYCRPNVLKTIRETKPKAILLLGSAAVKSVIGHFWKEDTEGIAK